MPQDVAHSTQQQNSKETIYITKKCDVQRAPFEVRVLRPIRQLYSTSKRVNMTTFHLALSCARTIILICNESMLGMWNKQMTNTTLEQQGSVSLHAGVVDRVPQFNTKVESNTTQSKLITNFCCLFFAICQALKLLFLRVGMW